MRVTNVARVSLCCLMVIFVCTSATSATSPEKSSRAIALVDDFEDGILLDSWTDDGGSCNPFITNAPTPPACPEGTNCLEIFGDCGDLYQGISTDLLGFEATTFSMYIRSDTLDTGNAYVVLDDDSDPFNGTVAIFLGNATPEWIFSSGAIGYTCGPRVAFQWYLLRFDFDWTARTVDVFIDGDLKHADIPITSSAATGLDYLYLFNYQSGTSYFDYITASSSPPEPPIFVDGFESGYTSFWSLTEP